MLPVWRRSKMIEEKKSPWLSKYETNMDSSYDYLARHRKNQSRIVKSNLLVEEALTTDNLIKSAERQTPVVLFDQEDKNLNLK